MRKYIFLGVTCMLIGCIGDDLIFDEVDPLVRIMNPVDTIEINSTYQFEVAFFNNIGRQDQLSGYSLSSTAPDIISVDNTGLASALKLGSAVLTVSAIAPDGKLLMDIKKISVGNSTVVSSGARAGSLKSTSSYALAGKFTLEEISGGVRLSFGEDYRASTALPGLYVYLSNNPNSNSGALEIGAVKVFSGPHSYDIKNTGLNEYSHVLYYCKPFRVKVGDGPFDN